MQIWQMVRKLHCICIKLKATEVLHVQNIFPPFLATRKRCAFSAHPELTLATKEVHFPLGLYTI